MSEMKASRANLKLAIAAALLASLPALGQTAPIVKTFWIEPCSVVTSACSEGDADLARWALDAWSAASQKQLQFAETKDRNKALLRFLWAGKDSGLYGEAVPILVNGASGSELHIQLPPPGEKDNLLRDTVVYLTCLHESGHALGLDHTAVFADIMYSFYYGGDLVEYFARYRRKLIRRDDIRTNSGMSDADRAALLRRVESKSVSQAGFR